VPGGPRGGPDGVLQHPPGAGPGVHHGAARAARRRFRAVVGGPGREPPPGPRRRRRRRQPARRHRSQDGRGGARPPRLPRLADGPREPGAVPQPGGPRPRPERPVG
jgi:hypothetical protein